MKKSAIFDNPFLQFWSIFWANFADFLRVGILPGGVGLPLHYGTDTAHYLQAAADIIDQIP